MADTVQLTDEWYGVSCDRQQVVHEEQEDGVAQDESHFEGGSVHVLWGEEEAEEVHCDEEEAGDQQVHHIHGWLTPRAI